MLWQDTNLASSNDGTTTTSYTYDANGRLSTSADALGNTTTYGYVQQSCGCSQADLVTNIHTPDLAALTAWQLAYSAEGRLAKVTDPDGFSSSFTYFPSGEPEQVVDANEHGTAFTHDSLGRLLATTDALGRTRTHAYAVPASTGWTGQDIASGSASGTAASTNFANALNVGDYQLGTNVYDTFGDNRGTRSNHWPETQFYRDATFQLSYGRALDEIGRTTSFFDRPASQLTASTVMPQGSGAVRNQTFTYVTAPNGPVGQVTSPTDTFTYNTEQDMTASTGGSTNIYNVVNNVTYTRDVAGRILGIQTIEEPTASDGEPALTVNQTFTYFPNGQVQSDPQGTYTYDSRGNVATRVVPAGTYSYQYDSMGRNSLLTFPDQHTRTQTYDDEGRIASRCYAYPSGLSRCYGATYDGVGNPTRLTDPEGTDTVTYDALDRVLTVSRASTGGVEDGVQSYGYNKVGALNLNASVAIDDQRPLLSGTGNGDATVPHTFGGAPVNLDAEGKITSLAGESIGYDLQGAVTSVAGTSISRDPFEREVGNPFTGEVFTYDGPNRSGAWQYQTITGRLPDGGAPPPPQWVKHGAWLYDGVDHPLEHADENGVRQYYELDLAGNVRRLVGAGGTDLGGYRYTAFGETYAADSGTPAPTGAASLPVRWKGRWLEYSTGSGAGLVELYDMRARWWWPQGGVFVSVDDFRFRSTRTTLWGWPSQNPVRWSDPTGHAPGDDYMSQEEATLAAEAELAAKSGWDKTFEWGGWVYYNSATGTWSYTDLINDPNSDPQDPSVNGDDLQSLASQQCTNGPAAAVHSHTSLPPGLLPGASNQLFPDGSTGAELASTPGPGVDLGGDSKAAVFFNVPIIAVGPNGTLSAAYPPGGGGASLGAVPNSSAAGDL